MDLIHVYIAYVVNTRVYTCILPIQLIRVYTLSINVLNLWT